MKKSPLTSNQINTLKWIALITMVIDHTPRSLNIEGLTSDVTATIGRIAFPIFAFLIAHNYNFYSKNPKKYITRLFIWGIISQPIYIYAFHNGYLNIILVLGLGLLLQKAMDDYELNKDKQSLNNLIFSFILSFSVGIFCSYGLLGVLLIPAFCLWIRNQDIYTFITLVIIILAINGFIGYAVIGLSVFPMLFILPKKNTLLHTSGWFFYLFYPLHLAILVIIRNLLQ
jgi:hypothetical protein